MGFVFYNGRYIPEERIEKSKAGDMVLRRLRSFLDKNEPGLVRYLYRLWDDQEKALTYKEIREAILAGTISEQLLEDWMQDYSRFATEYMLPAWQKAIAVAAAEKAAKYPKWFFDPMADGILSWVKDHSARFVTNVTDTQIEGLRALVVRASSMDYMTADDLSRYIRPMVGLTKPQTMANMNFYEKLIANGTSPKKAKEQALKYAAKQHRYRAYNIARTELAEAYNMGAYEATKQAQAAGYMGRATATWSTADDERQCPYCKDLEGKTVELDEGFDLPKGRKFPPAHPGCRCGYLIDEVSPPEK